MKMTELLEIQRKLDDTIVNNLCKKENKEIKHIDLIDKRFTALFVELYEFIEARRREDRLEEYVDILHFILSVLNTLEVKIPMIEKDFEEIYKMINIIKDMDYSKELFKTIGALANETKCFKYWSTKGKNAVTPTVYFLSGFLFTTFLQLGKINGFSAEEIISTYKTKNEENYNRQKKGY